MPQARLRKLAAEALAELRGENRTLKEMLALLKPHARPPATPAFLWRRLQGYAYVVHVPPSGIWGYHSDGVYAPADEWIPGESRRPTAAFDHIVRRYLAAFGPATRHDIGQWAGIPRLTPIGEALERLDLRTFRDESGRMLYDVPRAPLPDPDTPVLVRLVPRFDNLVLAHADRTRILGDVPVTRIVTKNAIVHATILVDGFVAGTWQLEKGRVASSPSAASHARLALRSPRKRRGSRSSSLTERVLTGRELNRAVLARQLLLERSTLPIPAPWNGLAESRTSTRRTPTSGSARASRRSTGRSLTVRSSAAA